MLLSTPTPGARRSSGSNRRLSFRSSFALPGKPTIGNVAPSIRWLLEGSWCSRVRLWSGRVQGGWEYSPTTWKQRSHLRVIVVADTSPINYLVQIACDSLLPDLYQRVLIPAAVLDELRSSFLSRVSQTLAINLAGLDRYQEDIFQLWSCAWHSRLWGARCDPSCKGRTRRCSLNRRTTWASWSAAAWLATTGTLGVLLAAHEKGLVDAHAAYTRPIKETSFRTTPELDKHFFQRIGK